MRAVRRTLKRVARIKRLLFLFIICSGLAYNSFAQGWVAVVNVTLNHSGYETETMESVSVIFSGISQSQSNVVNGTAFFVFEGTGTPNGELSIYSSGTASVPYYPDELPSSKSIDGSFTGTYSANCTEYYYYSPEEDPDNGYVYGSIQIFPELILNDPSPAQVTCGVDITLLTSTCVVGNCVWEVSNDEVSGFQQIAGKTSTTITLRGDELPGFSGNKYGTRHIRVWNAGRVSAVKTVLFLVPGPQVSIEETDLACHNDYTGKIKINITAASGSVIDDFALTLMVNDVPQTPQISLDNASTHTYQGLSANVTYKVLVENNTATGTYGACGTTSGNAVLSQPYEVDITGYSVDPVKCKDGNTGKITITSVTGGSNTGYTYTIDNVPMASNEAPGLLAGSYALKATDSKGCYSQDEIIAVGEPLNYINASIDKYNYRGYGVKCWDTSDGQITATVTNSVGPITYEWYSGASKINGATSQVITDLSVGTYSVVVRDGNNCTDASDNLTLIAPPKIDFSLTPAGTLICAGDETMSISSQLVAATIIGPPSYEWQPGGAEDADIFNVGAGTHSLTVTDNQGCAVTKSHIIVDPPAHTVSISPNAQYNGSIIKCNGESNGEISAVVKDHNSAPATANYHKWYKNGNLLDEGPSLVSIDQLGEGSYKVQIIYNGQCETESIVFPLNDPSAVSPDITVTSNYNNKQISCFGKSDGSLHASGSGGTGTNADYTYAWSTGITGADLSGVPSGTYTVTVKDINGCPGVANKTLNDPDPVAPSIDVISDYNGLAISCHNEDDAHLRASASGGAGGYGYSWNTGINGTDLVGLTAGTYTITVTDANTCAKSISKTLINPSPVTTSIAIISDFKGQPISCFNETDGALRASASGGNGSYTYNWSTGITGTDLSDVGAGTYTVTAKDKNNCPATASETLANPAPVKATITSVSDYKGYGVKCLNSNEGYIEAKGEGGTGDYTFYWPETGETSFRNANLFEGAYTVKVTDTNGCNDTETQIITEPNSLTLILLESENIKCFGGENGRLLVQPGGGVGEYQHAINNGDWQSSSEFPGLKAINHNVILKDGNSCTTTLTKALTQPEQISISYAIEPAFCNDPRGVAVATASGGAGSFIYEWKDFTNAVISITNTIQNKAAGTYSLKVKDGNNCELIEAVGITSTDGANVNTKEITSPKCSYSADGSALLEIVEGDGPFTFLWPNGQTTIQGSNLAKGLYQVSIKDKNDCIVVHPVDMPAPEILKVILVQTAPPNCNGDCNGRIKVIGEGGVGAYTYSWANQTGEEAQNLCSGSHKVQIKDSNNCVNEETFQLLQPEPLQLRLVSRELPLCNGGCNGEIEVEATGGNGNYQFNWSAGKTTSIASGICAGDHTVTVLDSKNCSLTGIFQLGEPTLLQTRLTKKKNPTCHDGCDGSLEVEGVGGTGGYQYSWSNGVNESTLANLCTSNYTVEIFDGNACKTSQTFLVENPPALSIDLGGSVTLCTGQTHTLNAGSSWSSYNWGSNTGATGNSSTLTIKDAGQYWLDVVNQDGCTAQDTFLLETSLDLLKASFLIPKEAVAGDTIAIIDISWPLPEISTWTFPTVMQKVLDLGDVIYGKFDEPGIFQIGLKTTLGQCKDEIGKSILILKGIKEDEGGRLGYEEYVKEFTLYPNPTDGNFEVSAALAEIGPVTISIWHTPTGYLVGETHDSGKNKYHWQFDLRPLSSGTYVLRLDHAKGKKYIRFVVK